MNGVHFFGFDCGFGVWMVLFLDLGSHLCGGEHVYPSDSVFVNFLSHLCGGEQNQHYNKSLY
ncbi:hypothetical protein BSPWISOX_141 [uncultured Gammaproteobacteria bacterium]|nr:hypothetical protein BSPWISOX_141 [uncultured Gammaproteobacteria bacterium]